MSRPTPPDQAARSRITCDLGCDLLVAAGAGSGKTTSLVGRYLALLESGLRPARIVVVTFTRKAAAEMKERVRQALRARAAVGEAPRWLALAAEVEDAPIETMDAFCARLLRGEALDAGLDPGFEVLDEAGAQALARGVAAAALRAALRRDDPAADALLGELESFPNALEALLAGLAQRRLWRDPFLALPAEPVARHVLAWLRGEAQDPPSPEQVTALLEERRREASAEALAALLSSALLAEWRAVWAELASGAAQAGDDKFRPVFAAGAQALASLDTDRDSLADDLRAWGAGDLRGGSAKVWGAALGDAKDVVRQVRAWLAGDGAALARDAEGERSCAAATAALLALLPDADAALVAAKAARGVLAFDDLLLATARLLRGEELRARLARRYERVLVDEYQDSNSLQDAVFRLLADPARPGAFFAVGDDKQSIYAFRGAQVEVFNRARAQAGDGLVALTATFRLAPALADVLNRVFGQPAAMGPEPEDDPAAARFVPLEAFDDPAREMLPGAPVRLLAPRVPDGLHTPLVEAAAVAESIVATHAEGVAWGQMAILLRATKHLPAYREALLARGVPVRTDRGALCRRQEALDLLALARWLVTPRDRWALATLLRSPLVGLRDDALCAALQPDGLAAWRGVFAGHTLAETLRGVVAATGYRAVLAALPEADRRLANVEALLDQIAAREQAGATPEEIVAALEQRRDEGSREDAEGAVYDADADAVSLFTVHAAKGLEWRVVWLADLDRRPRADQPALVVAAGGLPWAAGRVDDQAWLPPVLRARPRRAGGLDYEGERLLYVAATRARDRLVVCWPATATAGAGTWLAALQPGLGYDPQALTAGAGVGVEESAPDPHVAADDTAQRLARLAALRGLPVVAGQARLGPARADSPRVCQVSDLVEQAEPAADFQAEVLPHAVIPDRLWRVMDERRRGEIVHAVLAAALAARVAPTREQVLVAAAAAGVWLNEEVGGRDEVVADLWQAAARGFASPAAQAALAMPLARCEERLVLRRGRLLLEGRADLFGVSDDELLLVDFKTGSPDAAQQWSNLVEVSCYALMLAERFPGRRVGVVMPLVDLGREVRVAQDYRAVAARVLPGGGPP